MLAVKFVWDYKMGYNFTQERLIHDFFHTKIILTCILFTSCVYNIETVSIF